MSLRCSLSAPARFADVAADWNRLAQRYEAAPFLHADVVASLLEVWGQPDDVIVRVEEAGRVVALAVMRRQGLQWQTLQPSQMPLGLLVHDGRRGWSPLLAAIARALPGTVLAVGVTQQDPQFDPRPHDDPALATLDYITTAWVPVEGRFDDYWEARGKNLRQNLRKQRRRLLDAGQALTLEVIRRREDVAAAVADYARLESAGWKGGEGTAVAIDNEQGRFYVRMLEAACERGEGLILRYRIGDRVAVVDLCLQARGTLVVLKTTYDEAFHASSPAALMREEFFQQFWEQGEVRRVEFYGRMMEWHTRWTPQHRTQYHVTWHRWPWLTRGLLGRWRARAAAAPAPQAEAPAVAPPPAPAPAASPAA